MGISVGRAWLGARRPARDTPGVRGCHPCPLRSPGVCKTKPAWVPAPSPIVPGAAGCPRSGQRHIPPRCTPPSPPAADAASPQVPVLRHPGRSAGVVRHLPPRAGRERAGCPPAGSGHGAVHAMLQEQGCGVTARRDAWLAETLQGIQASLNPSIPGGGGEVSGWLRTEKPVSSPPPPPVPSVPRTAGLCGPRRPPRCGRRGRSRTPGWVTSPSSRCGAMRVR